MKYLIVIDNVIDNIIVSDDSEFAKEINAHSYYSNAEIGDLYNPPPDPLTLEDRVSNLESETADLNEALNMILTGVTE